MDENLRIILDTKNKAQNEQRKGKKKVQDERTQVLTNEKSSKEGKLLSKQEQMALWLQSPTHTNWLVLTVQCARGPLYRRRA